MTDTVVSQPHILFERTELTQRADQSAPRVCITFCFPAKKIRERLIPGAADD
jgi:hypothetical protein